MQSPKQQADGNNFWSPTYTPFKLIIQEWKPARILEQFPGPTIALQAITKCYISITSPSKRDKRESNKSKKQWHLQGSAELKECFTSALKKIIKIVCLLHVFFSRKVQRCLRFILSILTFRRMLSSRDIPITFAYSWNKINAIIMPQRISKSLQALGRNLPSAHRQQCEDGQMHY